MSKRTDFTDYFLVMFDTKLPKRQIAKSDFGTYPFQPLPLCVTAGLEICQV